MPGLDPFLGDAFSMNVLTDVVNHLDFKPQRIGAMGLFRERGVPSRQLMIEENYGTLKMIPNTTIGAPPTQYSPDKRKVRSLMTTHLPYEDTIMASEIEGVRLLGSQAALETIQATVNERLAAMIDDHEATLEHLRMGAVQGIILDADGSSVVLNLYTAFNVSAPTEVAFDFAGTGDIKALAHGVRRLITKALGAGRFTNVHCMCGESFWDLLTGHTEVKTAYDRWQDGVFLRSGGQPFTSFEYAGVMWEEYQGEVNGVKFVADDKCHFFPVGAGIFNQYNAPADFVETVNTIGLPRYAKQAVDAEFQRWVKLHVQANPLPICTKPLALIKGKEGA